MLDKLSVPYVLDPLLVRGLDYYSDTVFEIVATGPGSDRLGPQQATVLAGGRYNDLVRAINSKASAAAFG
jgi:histidyl-tRNA synthetase